MEILKGPAAILYGQGAGGATINRVLKRARPFFNTVITGTVADFGVRRAQLDTTGPLGAKSYRSTRVPTSGAAQPFWIVPEFKRLDLGLGYGWKADKVSYRATVNVENATDELLFGDNNQNDRYGMLAPRTWRFSLRGQF